MDTPLYVTLYWNLRLNLYVPHLEFNYQGLFIKRFQQSWTKMVIHLHGGPSDFIGKGIWQLFV